LLNHGADDDGGGAKMRSAQSAVRLRKLSVARGAPAAKVNGRFRIFGDAVPQYNRTMDHGTGSRFLPDRLPAISDRWNAWLRPAWFATLALAILLDLAGTAFVLRDVYENDPIFARVGLVSQFESDGSVTFGPLPAGAGDAIDIPEGSRIVAVDGVPVAHDTRVWTLAKRVERPEGQTMRLQFVTPDGGRMTKPIRTSARYAQVAQAQALLDRDVRMAIRMAISLATCFVLIGCGALLYLRRSRDAVAVLLSFAFLIFAGAIDPPLLMWMGLGTGILYDIYSTFGWVLLVVGLAAFPDGEFRPRAMRWVLLAAPLLAVPLTIESLPLPLMSTIAFVAPLGLMVTHTIKYRRYPEGIQRQQIKWAAFGFASGLSVLAITFFLVAIPPAERIWLPLYGLAILTLFNLGFLLMAVGLLVSLIRFRLWEADRVISRSAVAAGVTLAVGVVWTLTSDLVKTVVQFTMGDGHDVVATAAGALLAAGLFAPTQTLALRWTKRRFNRERERMGKLVARLASWHATETPEEIALRTLSALAGVVHSSRSAVLVDTTHGRALLAARDLDVEAPLLAPGFDPVHDRRFAHVLPLEDEDGPLGQLLLGPRSDFNRYNADELDCLRQVTEPLAESLRASIKRSRQVDTVHRILGEVEKRLSRLESGADTLPPALA
jgi:hypothetical protein